jgi:hypothetical protein
VGLGTVGGWGPCRWRRWAGAREGNAAPVEEVWVRKVKLALRHRMADAHARRRPNRSRPLCPPERWSSVSGERGRHRLGRAGDVGHGLCVCVCVCVPHSAALTPTPHVLAKKRNELTMPTADPMAVLISRFDRQRSHFRCTSSSLGPPPSAMMTHRDAPCPCD